MTTEETINKEIKQLKERIDILEEQRKQLTWEDKCFKIDRNNTKRFIKVHKFINKEDTHVKVLCDLIIYEPDLNRFNFIFNEKYIFDMCLLISISLNEYQQSINKIINDLNEKI